MAVTIFTAGPSIDRSTVLLRAVEASITVQTPRVCNERTEHRKALPAQAMNKAVAPNEAVIGGFRTLFGDHLRDAVQ